MKEQNSDVLIEIQNILAQIHDARVVKRNEDKPLSLIEMAALRDTIRRLNEVVFNEATTP